VQSINTLLFITANAHSYLFRLFEAANIRPYISETLKRKTV